jgi:MOSC domain-containing protein YiiM
MDAGMDLGLTVQQVIPASRVVDEVLHRVVRLLCRRKFRALTDHRSTSQERVAAAVIEVQMAVDNHIDLVQQHSGVAQGIRQRDSAWPVPGLRLGITVTESCVKEHQATLVPYEIPVHGFHPRRACTGLGFWPHKRSEQQSRYVVGTHVSTVSGRDEGSARMRHLSCQDGRMDRQAGVGEVVAVSRSAVHKLSKPNANSIRLVTGVGVHDDAHAGVTVQHRSRLRADPSQPNLRQVHLIQAELHDELRERGFDVEPGEMGENITTRGVGLLSLPRGTLLNIGATAVVEVTGLRNPCRQLDAFLPGLMEAVLDRDKHGRLIRKAGIMGIVVGSGTVCTRDPIRVALPASPHLGLEPV